MLAGRRRAARPVDPKTAKRIDEEIEKNRAEVVKIRRFIHMNPELGNREVETARLIAARLQPLGFEVRTGVAKTGVVAVLQGGQPGPAVAVRADMDALPVQEATGPPLQVPQPRASCTPAGTTSTARSSWGRPSSSTRLKRPAQGHA
ncbi:MAG: hypothetical protein MZV64_49415 [Ignavibacteriales bacterium]|nr:hypothetical protein [Ignavibacteriales bacterium]